MGRCSEFLAGVCLAALMTSAAGAAAAGPERSGVPATDADAKQKVYGRTAAESSPPSWPSLPVAPKGAPNVLVILTDDVGFGASSAFGGPIPTPTLDALAQSGARYNTFNTTAICSPTRASLLTGRDPTAVGVGYVTNWSTGYDGYNSVIPRSAGTVAQILKENGYNTAMFGKSHLTPEWEMSPAGPFDRWPTGLGFEYFYGFLGADSSQFEPTLVENTRPVRAPKDPNYHLDRDLADHAIDWIEEHRATAPGKPFFIYFATGAAHAPNHAPPDWLDRFKGRFDAGWDAIRADTVARQKAMGVIPRDADDAPRPQGLPYWNTLSADQKRLYARHMEAYAAQLSFADAQIGRVIDQLRRDGELDNTLIVFIEGDNGASEEGGLDGKMFEQSGLDGVSEQASYAHAHVDEIGGPATYPLNPGGWGWALNAPFPWAKHYASHFGGTRNGLVMSWPNHIRDSGVVRSQYHHVSDIMPTILEVAGVTPPAVLNGAPQQPITGISMAYTFQHGTEPSRRSMQVFGVSQNLSIYSDGWVAATKPVDASWDKAAKAVALEDRAWELYDTRTDFTEAHDIAAKNPRKLAQLKDLFWAQAARVGLLPIHPDEGGQAGRPALRNGRRAFTYTRPMSGGHETAAPSPVGRSFAISARTVIPQAGAGGVLVAQGGRYSGYSFFLDQGRLAFTYNLTPAHLTRIVSAAPVAPGAHVLEAQFRSDAPTPKSGGVLTLRIDGKDVAQGRIEQTFATIISHTEGFDVGQDSVTAVDPSYTVETSRFTGDIEKIEFRLD
jgi:arylsulfatase A-like enzyme